MAYRLYVRSVCDTTAPLQLQLPLVALYKCYAFYPFQLAAVIHANHCDRDGPSPGEQANAE